MRRKTMALALLAIAGACGAEEQPRFDLLAALEEARIVRNNVRFVEAFRAAGLEPTGTDAIRREYPDAAEEIAAALDDWAWLQPTSEPRMERTS